MSRTIEDAEIRRIAYRLWMSEGQPEGHDRQHWETAKEMWAFQTRAPLRDTPEEPKARRPKGSKLSGSAAL